MIAYPLAALLALRARGEAAARVALARAIAAEEQARAGRDAAARRAAVHQDRLAREAVALAAGEPGERAAGLVARASFVGRLRRETGALEDAARHADDVLRGARAETEARRATLAESRRALRAIERHQDGWCAEARRCRERREDAALDDLVSARRAAP